MIQMLGRQSNDEGEGDIRLRPLQKQDIKRITQWGTNPSPLLAGYNYGEMTFSEAFFWYRTKTAKNAKYFAIDHRDRKLIGYLGAKRVDFANKTALLGIVLDVNYQSRGYGKKAMHLFMDFYFHQWGMKVLNLEVNQFNDRALALYEDLGFRYIKESYERFENQDIDLSQLDQAVQDSFFYKNNTLYSKLWVMRKEIR